VVHLVHRRHVGEKLRQQPVERGLPHHDDGGPLSRRRRRIGKRPVLPDVLLQGLVRGEVEQILRRRQGGKAVDERPQGYHKARQRPGHPNVEERPRARNSLPDADDRPKVADAVERKRNVVGQRGAHPMVPGRKVVTEFVDREEADQRNRVAQPVEQPRLVDRQEQERDGLVLRLIMENPVGPPRRPDVNRRGQREDKQQEVQPVAVASGLLRR